MEKCGFVATGEKVLCPNLAVGADRPVSVMRLVNNPIIREKEDEITGF